MPPNTHTHARITQKERNLKSKWRGFEAAVKNSEGEKKWKTPSSLGICCVSVLMNGQMWTSSKRCRYTPFLLSCLHYSAESIYIFTHSVITVLCVCPICYSYHWWRPCSWYNFALKSTQAAHDDVSNHPEQFERKAKLPKPTNQFNKKHHMSFYPLIFVFYIVIFPCLSVRSKSILRKQHKLRFFSLHGATLGFTDKGIIIGCWQVKVFRQWDVNEQLCALWLTH